MEFRRVLFRSNITRAEDGYTNLQAKHFVRAAAIDPDARKFPFDLDLEARLMGQVASHEMGHNLGLKDGSYGKGVYTVAQVRDPAWVQRTGFTPSIMNYSRLNYVAQPENNMPSELLIQQDGPADRTGVVGGARVSVRGDIECCRIRQKQTRKEKT